MKKSPTGILVIVSVFLASLGAAFFFGVKKSSGAAGAAKPTAEPGGGGGGGTSSDELPPAAFETFDPGSTVPPEATPPVSPPPTTIPGPVTPKEAPKPTLVRFPATMKTGRTYRARLTLSGLEKLGKEQQIADAFVELGFGNVRVFMDKSSLPQGWPTSTTGDSAERFIEGTWNSSPTTIDKPPQIAEAYEV